MVLAPPSADQNPATKPSNHAESGLDLYHSGSIKARIQKSSSLQLTDGAYRLELVALGTRCRIDFSIGRNHAQVVFEKVIDWLARFEAKFSRFWPDSLVSRINREAGLKPTLIDSETFAMLSLCEKVHFITSGVMDPASLPLLQLWNWKTPDFQVPNQESIRRALALVGWRNIKLQQNSVFLPLPGMGLDLGGIGKEYAVDRVAELLQAMGAQSALVNFGGDVKCLGLPSDGRPGWHIGLEDPFQSGRCWRGVGIVQGAVATSGDYVRHSSLCGRRFGHIVDVRTGEPVNNGCGAVSVIAPTCVQAGIISTTAFILGPEAGMRFIESQFGAAGAMMGTWGTKISRQFHQFLVS